MVRKTIHLIVGASAAMLFAAGAAEARDQIRVVGSSTVFPFTAAVSEEFGKTTSFKAPIVESTGTGGGFKEFCKGVGFNTPDVSNASRRIKPSEIELCAANGVSKITEVKIGYDGIVLANVKSAPRFNLSLRDIYLALAKQVPAKGGDGTKLVANPYKKWSEIDPKLPDIEIEVLGPPPTSGTRDAFTELAMEAGCASFPGIAALEKTDKAKFTRVCTQMREDGPFIEAGERDNEIVQKLQTNPSALGIFGYSFLDQNRDTMNGSLISGVEPAFDKIASGEYPISRSLFIYVKNAHVGAVPGLKEFLDEFTDEDAWGEFGYLADKGLIPMEEDEREQFAEDAEKLKPLTAGS